MREPDEEQHAAGVVDVGGWVLDWVSAAAFGFEAAKLLAPLSRVGEAPLEALQRLLALNRALDARADEDD